MAQDIYLDCAWSPTVLMSVTYVNQVLFAILINCQLVSWCVSTIASWPNTNLTGACCVVVCTVVCIGANMVVASILSQGLTSSKYHVLHLGGMYDVHTM